MNFDEQVLRPSVLRQVMAAHGFQLKKGYGQNFLTDLHVLEEIIGAAGVGDRDGVFEVGPGAGVVTRPISFHAKRVVAVEKDRTLQPVLAETLRDRDNVELVYDDVLRVDLRKLWQHFDDCEQVVAVANLPYYVTTPILFHLLESDVRLSGIVVMVQKEVADRMMAQPGSRAYGALSVSLQARAKVTRITVVPPGAFLPPPNVASAVMKLAFYDQPPVTIEHPQWFRRTVKAAFGTRRKTLRNAIANGFGMSRGDVETVLTTAGIPGERRGETLSLAEFAQLAEVLSQFSTAQQQDSSL